MAKYIIDTQALIWFLTNPKRLGPEAKKAFKDPKSEFYILTDVFDQIRHKFEKFKKDNITNKAIKIPPIIIWLIAKKTKNVKIRKLDHKLINKWVIKNSDLRQIKKDDIPFVVKQLVLKDKFPRTEVKIITCDNNIRKNKLTRTCW